MSYYTSRYPDVPVDPALKKYFEDFYKTSDTPGADEKYANSFTEDATLTMASKTVTGRSGMKAVENMPLNAELRPWYPLSIASSLPTVANMAVLSDRDSQCA